jgi:S1-C subfamily serine protease
VRPFDASEATGVLVGAEGAMIHRIIPASPVARAGVPREALITHIDDEPVSSTEEVTRILGALENQGGAALLRVIRKDGRVLFYDVAIDDIAP